MMKVNEDWGCQKTRYPLDMVMILFKRFAKSLLMQLKFLHFVKLTNRKNTWTVPPVKSQVERVPQNVS